MSLPCQVSSWYCNTWGVEQKDRFCELYQNRDNVALCLCRCYGTELHFRPFPIWYRNRGSKNSAFKRKGNQVKTYTIHTLVMKDQMMFQDDEEAKNRPFLPSNFFLPSSGKIHRILEHVPKRNVVFVVSAARVPYILRTLFPGSVTVTTAMLEMFPSCRKDDTGHLFTRHITSWLCHNLLPA